MGWFHIISAQCLNFCALQIRKSSQRWRIIVFHAFLSTIAAILGLNLLSLSSSLLASNGNLHNMMKSREGDLPPEGVMPTVLLSTSKGCPQRGVLSPLLCSLIVDYLLNSLVAMGFEVIGYEDDIVIVVREKHDETLSNRMQIALNYTLAWCKGVGLNVNPSKTNLVIFTRKRNVNMKAPSLDGVQLTFSSRVKYLGVILDKKN